ncbi:MAG: porin family protein [Bacteroidetes bacterium]|nr:porin family protein [Bacteroidota bacterium]
MKKNVFFLVVLSLFVGGLANAQVKLGANFGLQIPLGNFLEEIENPYDMGFGGNITGKYMVTENIGAGLGFGFYYLEFKGGYLINIDFIVPCYDYKEVLRKGITIMPVTASGYYYFRKKSFKPYVGVELGAYMMRVSYKYEYDAETETHFGFAPVVGAQYDLFKSFGLNVNLKESYIFGGTYGICVASINIGIVYTFGK